MRMRRREFIAGLGSAAAWPLAARAQQAGKLWRIGFIGGASRASTAELWPGIPQGLRELGYVEGRDFVIEWRYADGNYERYPAIAAELVQLKVDVIVLGTMSAVRAVQQATSTIPIVLANSTDPVGLGLVASLAHPGGQITGLATSQDDSVPKQLELLAAMVPNLSRVGFLFDPADPPNAPVLRNAQVAAHQAGLAFVQAAARNADEFDTAWQALIKERVGAVIVLPDAFFYLHRQRIAEAALAHRLPTMFSQNDYTEAGGLMSYGENLKDFYRRAGVFIDKIFKGAKPGDLPIEQPTRFNLVINRKVADVLGLAIPLHLYIFADKVIE
jgi:putative ABC transport system substrate-binding protein